MKIVIPGGTGQVGTMLARSFHARGYEVVVLSRGKYDVPWRVVQWDGESLGAWTSELEGADALVNLCGRSVNCRYGWKNRMAIMQSRLRPIRALASAVSRAKNPPRVWLQASTATIYEHTYGPAQTESGTFGGLEPCAPETWKFSSDVAESWEGLFARAELPRTRKVFLRTAMTMSPDPGGVFSAFLFLVRCGFGGTIGDGRQYMSWIHELDFIRAIDFLIADDCAQGVYNIAAPNPLPNSEFMAQLRMAQGRRFGLPTWRWALEIGAFFIRTESELLLKSRRVIPERLLEAGFKFRYPAWQEAANELCERRSESRRSRGGIIGARHEIS